MNKMTVKEQAAKRAEIYSAIENQMKTSGYAPEVCKKGMLLDLGDGNYGIVKVTVCNPEKFDLEETRREYAEALVKKAERAEAARIKAEQREAKAKAKAEKAAEKANN